MRDNTEFRELGSQLDARELFRKYGNATGKIKNGQLKTLCPFHDDTTPSLTVFKDGYNCMSCGAHGGTMQALQHLVGVPWSKIEQTARQELGLADLSDEERAERKRNEHQREEQRRREERARQQREHLATLSRQDVMMRLWLIVKDAPQTDRSSAWLAGRGIDPDHAHQMGCRDWSTKQRAIDALLDKLTDDQLKDAGLLNDEGKRWFPLKDWSSPGLAVPCWHPGESAPYAYRWRLFEPWVNKDGKKTKTLQQPSGNDGQSHRGQVLGLHQAQDATHLVIVEGEPDWLSASQILAHLPDVGVVGVCGITDVRWGNILAGHVTHLTVCTHHDRDKKTGAIKSAIDAVRKNPNLFDRLATHLVSNDLEINVRVVDVRGDHDLNDQHQARGLAWLVDAVEGSIPTDIDFTDGWCRLFERTQQAHEDHLILSMDDAQYIRHARPITHRFDDLGQLRQNYRLIMRDALRREGVTVDNSSVGTGKTHSSVVEAVNAIDAENIRLVVIASPTLKTCGELHERIEDHIMMNRLDMSATMIQGRDHATCQMLDDYLYLNKAAPRAGAAFCNQRCPHQSGCPFVSQRKKIMANAQKSNILIVTHDTLPWMLSVCEEIDVIIYDESLGAKKAKLTADELFAFRWDGDVEGSNALEDAIRKSAIEAERVDVAPLLGQMTVNFDGENTRAGARAIDEYKQDTSRTGEHLGSWQALAALQVAQKTNALACYIRKGELHMPCDPRPDFGYVKTVLVLDASATQLTAQALYGEHHWQKLAITPNTHIHQINIITQGSKSAYTPDDEGGFKPNAENAHLARLWARSICPDDTLIIGHKHWYEHDEPPRVFDGEHVTWHKSAKTRGYNGFEHLPCVLCTDFNVPKAEVNAYADQLTALLTAQGIHINRSTAIREAHLALEYAPTEQAIGRIRPLSATDQDTKTIIYVGKKPPSLEYVPRENVTTITEEQILLGAFNRTTSPKTIERFLDVAAEKSEGLFLSNALFEKLNNFNELHNAAEITFNILMDSPLPIASNSWVSKNDLQKHQHTFFQELQRLIQNKMLFHSRAVEIKNNIRQPFLFLPSVDDVSFERIASAMESRGVHWFEVGSWRYEWIDGQWLTDEQALHVERDDALAYLIDSGVTSDDGHKTIYGELSVHWSLKSRRTAAKAKRLFGSLQGLKNAIAAVGVESPMSTANHAEQQMRPEHTAPTPASMSGWAAPSPNPHEPARRGDAEAAVYRAAPTPIPECIDEPEAEMTAYALTLREYRSQFGAILAHLISQGATRSTPDGRLISLISDCHDCPGEWFETMEDELRDALPGTPPAQPKPDYSDFEILF